MAIMDLSRLCIDTGPLIAYLRGQEPAAAAVGIAVKECDCYVTTITVYEIFFGVARARKQIGEDALLRVLTVMPLDAQASRRAAHLHNDLIVKNADIGIKDVLIAAICLEQSLPLLTLNDRHFSRVPGLTVILPERLVGRVPLSYQNKSQQ